MSRKKKPDPSLHRLSIAALAIMTNCTFAKMVANRAIELDAIERKKALKRQRTEKRRRVMTDDVMNKLYREDV